MRVLAGTSGFSYPKWRGSFYPEKHPAGEMLSFYASRLPTVEINNSFYRMPQPELLQKWADETPEDFSMVLKAPRRITHIQRLKNAAENLARLAEVSESLGPRRGPVLFQLPPNFRKDTVRLTDFLGALAKAAPKMRAAFEFRHPTWFDDEVYGILEKAGACLCAAQDDPGLPVLRATTDWGYLRLRRTDYTDADLADWVQRLAAQPWKSVHVFFKHEDAGLGAAWAEKLLKLVKTSQNNKQ